MIFSTNTKFHDILSISTQMNLHLSTNNIRFEVNNANSKNEKK